MAVIVTRAGKGSPLTNTELDSNFTNLNAGLATAAITGGTITGITDLAVADGGTGASTAAGARTNLGLGSIATQASGSVSITGGTISGITDLAVADGGTGASDAAGARTNLGLVIGTDVPAYGSTTTKTSATGSSVLPSGTTAQRDGTPSAGYLRFNSSTTEFEGYNGTTWGSIGGSGASVTISDTAPSSPTAGDMWLDSTTGSLYVYFTDADSSQWIGTVGPSGPTGPAGTTDISFSIPGTLATGTGTMRWYITKTMTITNVVASVGTAPTGASAIFDVNKNGTTIFTTSGNRPTIAISGYSDLTSAPDVTTLASGDYLTVDVDQIGSTVAGANAVIRIQVV